MVTYKYFSSNGKLLPISQATISLSNIEYAYGFGVYETVRVNNGIAYFLSEHVSRLLKSAEIISLEHTFTTDLVSDAIDALIKANDVATCNIKILLIGGPAHEDALLYALCFNPLFPDRKLYQAGAHFITYTYQRLYPGAKTLNMLPSYLAYREAKQNGAYDALLTDHNGSITEGTRTNFFGVRGNTIFSAPEIDILPGVMRRAVITVAKRNNFDIQVNAIHPQKLAQYDGAFVTKYTP